MSNRKAIEKTAADREADVERAASRVRWSLETLEDALRAAGKHVPEWLAAARRESFKIEAMGAAAWDRLTAAEKCA